MENPHLVVQMDKWDQYPDHRLTGGRNGEDRLVPPVIFVSRIVKIKYSFLLFKKWMAQFIE